MKKDFTNSLKSNIEGVQEDIQNNEIAVDSTNLAVGFKVKKKVDDKTGKKSIPVYIEPNLLKDLERVAKKSGYSRNEMINKMIEHCVNTFELEE